MSITFTDQLDKPSEITTIPNQLLRPVFGALYGFDVPVGGSGTPAIFNVTTRDTEANILASTPTNPSGEVNIAFGTDTYDFYIYSGGLWYIYNDTPAFANQYSVSFDGTDDYMDFGTNTTINSSSAFSVSAWFNVNNIASYPSICILKTNGSNGFSISLSNTTGANAIYNGVWFGSAPTGDASQFKAFATNNTTLANAISSGWHHLVLTYDGVDHRAASSTTVYIDGVEYASSQAVGFGNYGTGNYVGKGAVAFDGLIDEFAVFDSKLSASDVTAIYNSGVPADISSLNPVGWWRMGENDGGTGTTITDQGSGGNNGTLTNGPTFSTTVPS